MLDRLAWAEIDLGAFQSNVKRIKDELGASTRLCAIVKADAYGHGIVPMARKALQSGASCLGVALISEGIALREAGFVEPVLVMGLCPPELAQPAVFYGLDVSAADMPGIEALSAAAVVQNKTVGVHLKIDSGLGRLGIRPDEALRYARAIHESDGLRLAGVFSHFADADSDDLSYTRQQLRVFLAACSDIERDGIPIPCKHIANSAGFLYLEESRLDMVRTGILMYGYPPNCREKDNAGYLPVMTLKAKASFVKTVNPGESLSYGRRWTADKQCRIATVPLGYADGYFRSFTNKGLVGVRGRIAPVRGAICMDQFMIDVSEFDDFKTGEEVVVFGKNGPSLESQAALIGTITWEMVCRLGKRVPRVYS